MKMTLRENLHHNREAQPLVALGGCVEILDDDGRALFTLRLNGGTLEVCAVGYVKIDGVLMDTAVAILPISSSTAAIKRLPYPEPHK